MNDSIKELLQELGEEALSNALDRTGKLLIYAEVEKDVVSALGFPTNGGRSQRIA